MVLGAVLDTPDLRHGIVVGVVKGLLRERALLSAVEGGARGVEGARVRVLIEQIVLLRVSQSTVRSPFWDRLKQMVLLGVLTRLRLELFEVVLGQTGRLGVVLELLGENHAVVDSLVLHQRP